VGGNNSRKMQITLNRWFNLPFLGRDVFADLMKAKVEHDKRLGFRFTSATNVGRALSVLSRVLQEPVEMARSCFICENPLTSSDSTPEDEKGNSSGVDGESMAQSKMGEMTLCAECQENPSAFELYVLKFAKLMETV
jgi:hypothetical protein